MALVYYTGTYTPHSESVIKRIRVTDSETMSDYESETMRVRVEESESESVRK